jgi:hypothetical protein
MGKKLLLLWDDMGGSLKAFVFDAASEEAALARASVGLYINSDDIDEDHPIEQLSEAICNERWSELDASAVLSGPFDEVVICGFMP